MPYREKILTNSSLAALADEARLEVDTALAAHPAWTKVTNNQISGSMYFDVWQNNGSADGYGWYLIIGRHSTSGYVLMCGALEYDAPTFTFKKALRGYSGLGFVNAAGYPLVSSGGAEMTFVLGSSGFTPTSSLSVGNLGGRISAPTALAQTNWFRTLVTARSVWVGWGTSTALNCCGGVSTYQNLFSTTQDLKPLAHVAVNNTSLATGATTVWQHPSATDINYARNIMFMSTASDWSLSAASVMSGQVGGSTDILYGAPVGSRMLVTRSVEPGKTIFTNSPVAGGFLGLFPADFLLFNKTAGSGTVGDTITVNGKTCYIAVGQPVAATQLFINTQPDT